MTLLRIYLVCAWVLVLGGLSPALGQSEREALIAAFNAEIEALNTGDLNTAVVAVHDKIVLYGLYSPFPSRVRRRSDRPFRNTSMNRNTPHSKSSIRDIA